MEGSIFVIIIKFEMDILLITFQSVAVLLGIGVLGFWIIAKRILPENLLGFLTTLAIDISLPCLVFSSIMLDFSPDKFPDWWQLTSMVALVLV